ncbi:DEAD/DEAH box helicase [Cerasicoccus maritimus]|uniref:DEAD/DEAH box helicase n=1 Tax=Cerasicoccus maritimus TaxID=490089 RepID=UPI002852C8FA|nr:DEAD/DEAH box helicase [Cerasicoccus maritimus]
MNISSEGSRLGSWEAISPVLFYNLASRTVLERGIRYFEQERVVSLRIKGKNSFDAQVLGSSTYRVSVVVSTAHFRHHCNCPAYDRDRVCKHVVAVVALLYYLGSDRLFGHYKPSGRYLRSVVEHFDDPGSILSSKEKAGPSSSTEIVVLHDDYHELYAQINGRISVALIRKLGFYRDAWQRRAGWLRSFCGENIAGELSDLVGIAQSLKIPVYVANLKGKRVELNGKVHRGSIRYRINVDQKSEQVELVQDLPEILGSDAWRLAESVFIHSSGELIDLSDDERNLLVNMADPEKYFSPSDRYIRYHYLSFGRGAKSREKDDFNAISLAVAHSEYVDDLKATQLECNGQSVDLSNVDAPRPVKAAVVIKGEEKSQSVFAHIELSTDGANLPVESMLLECLRSDLIGNSINPQLTRAKGRLGVLIDAIQALSFTNDKRQRSEIIKEATGHQSFQKLRLKSKAQKWLRMIVSAWITTNDKHLLASSEHKDGWIMVESPHRLLLQLVLGLCRTATPAEIRELSSKIMIPRVELPRFIQRANLVCSATGTSLRYNEQAVRSIGVAVTLEANQGREIDWFELKAEVRCGTLTIPADQWEALIRGDLLLEQDGELIIPDLSQAEAIKRLQALFGTSKRRRSRGMKEETVAQAPRLQMLDWLELRQAGVQVTLAPAIEKIWQSLLSFSEIPSMPLPSGVSAKLRDYQQQGFEWMAFLYEHRFGACLADDMGLGKTLQSIAFLAWVKKQQKSAVGSFLIVLPPSLIFNWRHEIERFCPSLSVSEYLGGNRNLSGALQSDVTLTTYDLVRRDIELLQKHTFEVVIFDEAQALKNITAVRTKAALKLKRRFTLCLTGTPMENHAGEYYSIMNLATPGIFGDYREFKESLRNGDEHILRRSRPFTLRRTKDQILKELPPKVESEFYLEMTEEQKEIYTRTVGEVREEVLTAYKDKTRSQAGIIALAALTRLRQVCISPELLGKPIKHPAPKLDYLTSKMHELLDEGHCGLFFSQFARTLDLLEDAATKEGLNILRLDGKTPVGKRKKLVKAFQESTAPQLFLISLKAGGVGLNLTRAQYVFHIDPWWNPAVENQASDRAHRIGQTKTVFIQRLLMRHSVEEKIMELKKRKQKLFEAIVESSSIKASAGSLVSRDDFEFLLSDTFSQKG